MSKKDRELLKHRQIGVNGDIEDAENILQNLENAWNNLPDDLCEDERTLFLDLVEKLAKMHWRVAKTIDSDDLEKN